VLPGRGCPKCRGHHTHQQAGARSGDTQRVLCSLGAGCFISPAIRLPIYCMHGACTPQSTSSVHSASAGRVWGVRKPAYRGAGRHFHGRPGRCNARWSGIPARLGSCQGLLGAGRARSTAWLAEAPDAMLACCPLRFAFPGFAWVRASSSGGKNKSSERRSSPAWCSEAGAV
jgi:hypothetical protein